MGWGLRVWGFGAYGVLGFGLRVWGWGLGCLVWGLGLWVGSLDSLQNINSFGCNQDFFQKPRDFWLRNYFQNLDIFSKRNFLSTNRTPSSNQIRKIFVKA